jgi:phage shock protein A
MQDLHTLHDRAIQASDQARAAVEANALALQKKLAERTKLLGQLDQAKMQERMNEAMTSMTELAPKQDTPTLEQVRERIEGRYARALGQAELSQSSVEARMLEVEKASLDVEGAARLEAIRESLNAPKASPEVASGDRPAVAPPDGSSPGA